MHSGFNAGFVKALRFARALEVETTFRRASVALAPPDWLLIKVSRR
jgi:hypothetical protein